MAVTWAVWLVPLALLALGTPIYLCFLAGGVLILTLVGMPSFLVPQVMFGSLEVVHPDGDPVLSVRRGADGPQRDRRPADPLVHGDVSRACAAASA